MTVVYLVWGVQYFTPAWVEAVCETQEAAEFIAASRMKREEPGVTYTVDSRTISRPRYPNPVRKTPRYPNPARANRDPYDDIGLRGGAPQ